MIRFYGSNSTAQSKTTLLRRAEKVVNGTMAAAAVISACGLLNIGIAHICDPKGAVQAENRRILVESESLVPQKLITEKQISEGIEAIEADPDYISYISRVGTGIEEVFGGGMVLIGGQLLRRKISPMLRRGPVL
jgi:hypothetical protein